MIQILPSIIGKNQQEVDERFDKVKSLSDWFQLDVMDGKFVSNKSLDFDFRVPRKKYEAHLMMINPLDWIEKHAHQVHKIIIPFESDNFEQAIKLIKKKRKIAGIGINPGTTVKQILPLLSHVSHVTVMTVIPGKYGAKFLPKMLDKVKKLREIVPELDIECDGGMHPGTLEKAKKAGANLFVVGSYLQNAQDPKYTMQVLRNLVEK